MVLGGKEDRELNLLLETPQRRVGRRGFLGAAALVGIAGAAGYAGGTVAGREDGGRPAAPVVAAEQVSDPAIYPPSDIKLSIVTTSGEQQRKWQDAYAAIVDR